MAVAGLRGSGGESRRRVGGLLAPVTAAVLVVTVFDGAIGGWQAGTSTVDGVDCPHLFFIKRGGVEVELWVENNEASLPHRVVVTYRLLPGQPSFIAELTGWDARVRPSDSEFAFKPPAGARRVELAAPAAEGTDR